MKQVNFVWQPQPGGLQLSAQVQASFAIDPIYQVSLVSSYNDVDVAARGIMIDNLANGQACTVQLGQITFTLPAYQRKVFPVPPSANLITVTMSAAGVVPLTFFNYDPGAADAIDFYAILRQLALTSFNYAIDTGLADAYVGSINPAPVALINGQVVVLDVKTDNTGGPVVFNLNGFGNLPCKVKVTSAESPGRTQTLADPPPGTFQAGQIIYLTLQGGVWQPMFYTRPRGQQALAGAGNFTVPQGVFKLFVDMIAGGGGGGGTVLGSAAAGGGGGSGTLGLVVAVVPGQVIAFSVGQGGAGGNAAGSNGVNGTDSIFGGASVSGGVGGQGYVAGAFTDGVPPGPGGAGASAPAENKGGLYFGGWGGGTILGSPQIQWKGVLVGAATIVNGTAGNSFGSGGTGAAAGNASAVGATGGNGSAGMIIVRW